MGPEATVDFMKRVIMATNAEDDADHIRMIVDNNPQVPSRIKAIVEGTGESPASHLAEMAQSLVSHGADFLVMPCNTAHYYHNEISAAVNVPVMNMINLTVEAIMKENPGIRIVGLLASDAVLNTKLYHKSFEAEDVKLIHPAPERQQNLMKSIGQIKKGKYGTYEQKVLQSAAASLEKRGAEALIIGCTELSVIWNDSAGKTIAFDSSQVLAEATVKAAKHWDANVA